MGDDKMVARRGHLVVLRKTHPKQFYFFSGGCWNGRIMYLFCRQMTSSSAEQCKKETGPSDYRG